MLRTLALITLLALTMTSAASIALRDARPAGACSFAIPRFDDHVAAASFIGVIRVESTGDATNRQPTRTPNPAPITETTSAGASSETPSATPTLDPILSLQGSGARASVVETMYGQAPASFDLDQHARELHERSLRQAEWSRSSCPVFTAARYEAGSSYLLIMESPETGPNTLLRYEIQGDAAAIERLDLDPGFSVYGAIRASVPLYDRFFSAYPVVRSEGEPREILPPSVKLTDLVAAVDAIRSDTISLPNTGNAGLADPRLGLR